MKKSEINFNISLDENHVPEKLEWVATDANEGGECGAVMMSMWDGKANSTLRIDLWTKEMMVDDMKKFFHQSLLTMSDTFERATNEKEMADEMREFSKNFAEKMNLL
jgi:gliding motility-associated protein GldC